jgi:hypothetical protein
VAPVLRATAALLTSILAAAALAACGGSSGGDAPTTADFRTEYAPISAVIRGIGDDIGTAVTNAKTKTDAQLQSQFGDLAKRTATAADALADTHPPDDSAIKQARTQLITGVRQGASDLAAISAAASLSDAAAAKAATIKLINHSAAVKAPRVKLDELVLSSN